MQKSILASVILVALSACDSGSGVLLSPDGTVVDTGTGTTTGTTTATGNQGTGTTTDGVVVTTEGGSTDTGGSNNGGSTSDGTNTGGNTTGGNSGETTNNTGDSSSIGGTATDTNSGTNGTTNGSNGETDGDKDDTDDGENGDDLDVKDDLPPVTDDSGSATSDGGEVTDDSGSATSDGGEVTDDSGSATSDGGEVTDDSGSATSDGGQVTDDSGSSTSDDGVTDDSGSGTSDGGQNTGGTGTSDGGSFESDQIGGSVIRTSSLVSANQQNLCTTASDQNNFGDTRVGDFILHNNAWRPWRAAPDYQWEQCIYTNTNSALVGWYYDWGPGQTGINGSPNASGDYYVRSYPELIYGVKDEYRTSAPKSVTGFPVRLGDMPNISIDYSYDGPQYGESRTVDASNNSRFPNGTTISGERNVAIESFLYNTDANGECSEGIVTRNGGSNHVYEIMVWLDAGAERLPAGPSDFVANVDIRGEAFKVYTKAADPRYIAFVSQNPQTTGTLYWNDFTDWSKTYAHRVQEQFGARSNSVQIQDDWCVANIIVGTEIFWGSGNLDIYDWTITQRQP